MGYDIRPMSEIDTFNYSLCDQFCDKNTVRKSVDNTLFIVQGNSFTAYTQEEMLIICDGANWNPVTE